ncbi:hypothetical protein HYV83_05770 [Candidatus Woesearchaeota archaeon]|nr:hypothetical protein [Candidatus Woesearchaeota archaeon]
MITGKLQQELEEILAREGQPSEQDTAEERQSPERLEQTIIDKALHAAQKNICYALCLDLLIDWDEYRNSIDYARNAPVLRRRELREHFYNAARRTIVNLVVAGGAAATVVSAQAGFHVVAILSATVTTIPFLFARGLYKESFVTKYWG